MPAVDLPSGTLHYQRSGRGTPIVFLHGYLMAANLWDPVIRQLDGEFGCIAPELPFGAHPTPMMPNADLTTAAVGRLAPTSSRRSTSARSSWWATTAGAPSPRWWPPATQSDSVGWC
jgi:pimeloyl-ACP methyl ester carboxylesterase